MILLLLILVPLIAGILAWIVAAKSIPATKFISLIAMGIEILLLIWLFVIYSGSSHSGWLMEYRANWIPAFGISLHLTIDGLSLLLTSLTALIGFLSILVSWKEITTRIGFFYFNILWILAGIMGVFLAMDLFVFYFFWELMLVPMYFLIGIWGHETKTYASNKFFLYTQTGGLLMLIAILALYFIHGRNTGIYTFDYHELLNTPMAPAISRILMYGFLAAFLVKLPVVPLHNWLPDAHTEAPTAGSVILAALMLKTGAYGLIRFAIPLFPAASVGFAPIGMIIGIIGIIYGAMLALSQRDFKRLVAYTSVSHMGFVVLGIYSFNQLAMQGVVVQMIAHAISTGALFILAGQLQERLHTRDLQKMGGFWSEMPVLGGMALIFSLASLGLPGLGNFIAEFLILTGTFHTNVIIASVASIGLIFATLYSLRIMRRIFYGKNEMTAKISDASPRELLIYSVLVIAIVYLGLFPKQVLDTSRNPVINTLSHPALPSSTTGYMNVKQIQ